MMRFGMGGIGMLGAWIINAVLIIALLALLVLAIVALVKYISRQNKPAAPAYSVSSSLAILDERYARGELSDEEYVAKKEMLRKP